VSGETEALAFNLQPAPAVGLFFAVPFKKTTKIALQLEALLSAKGIRIAAEGSPIPCTSANSRRRGGECSRGHREADANQTIGRAEEIELAAARLP
jgi:hypothetical protein